MLDNFKSHILRTRNTTANKMILGDANTHRIAVLKLLLQGYDYEEANNNNLEKAIRCAEDNDLILVIKDVQNLTEQNQALLNQQLAKKTIRTVITLAADIEEEVQHDRFREDLFYRLNTLTYNCKPMHVFVDFKDIEYAIKTNVAESLYSVERSHILNVLKHFSGNKTQAANSLGITIKTLYNKLHEYEAFDRMEEK